MYRWRLSISNQPINKHSIAELNVKDFDSIVKTVISAAIVWISVFVIDISGDVKVHDARIVHIEASQKESMEVYKELTKAVTDLRIVIETIRK